MSEAKKRKVHTSEFKGKVGLEAVRGVKTINEIGQEGLDFHWYCNRVVHWNLPSNPIDIEQREGRVNRYKSLVVRRRAAEYANSHGLDLDQPVDSGDYWETLFSEIDRLSENRTSDLTPYWHIPSGTAQIERLVPMMPMSREEARLDEALKILSLYRLAFGQPRQEELLGNLVKRKFSEDEWKKIRNALVINLAPLNQCVMKGDETCLPEKGVVNALA